MPRGKPRRLKAPKAGAKAAAGGQKRRTPAAASSSSSSAPAPKKKKRRGASEQHQRIMAGVEGDTDEGQGAHARTEHAQRFFAAQARSSRRSKNASSSASLDSLELPSAARQRRLLAAHPVANAAEKARLEAHHRSQFRRWFTRLRAGFSLLLYGLGSKHRLACDFAREWLTDAPVVVVNGYAPAVSVRAALSAITRDVLQHEGSFRDPLAQVDFVRRALADPRSVASRVYVLVHNIDGRQLRRGDAQAALAALAAVPGVHLVATADHVRATLLWDVRALARFQWASVDATTFAPYARELAFEAPVVGDGDEGRAKGIQYVLRSLTPNHRDILAVLAEQQLAAGEGGGGVAFREFFAACQDRMLVTSDVGFRAHLTELLDHDLVTATRAAGQNVYEIPHPPDRLRALLAECRGGGA